MPSIFLLILVSQLSKNTLSIPRVAIGAFFVVSVVASIVWLCVSSRAVVASAGYIGLTFATIISGASWLQDPLNTHQTNLVWWEDGNYKSVAVIVGFFCTALAVMRIILWPFSWTLQNPFVMVPLVGQTALLLLVAFCCVRDLITYKKQVASSIVDPK